MDDSLLGTEDETYLDRNSDYRVEKIVGQDYQFKLLCNDKNKDDRRETIVSVSFTEGQPPLWTNLPHSVSLPLSQMHHFD